jgi:hypothetical protein
MVSVRFSPTHIPTRPSSQPLITCPTPTRGGRERVFLNDGEKKIQEDWAHGSMVKVGHGRDYTMTQYSAKVGKKSEQYDTYLESNLLPLENSFPVYVCARWHSIYSTSTQRRKKTHIMNLDSADASSPKTKTGNHCKSCMVLAEPNHHVLPVSSGQRAAIPAREALFPLLVIVCQRCNCTVFKHRVTLISAHLQSIVYRRVQAASSWILRNGAYRSMMLRFHMLLMSHVLASLLKNHSVQNAS